MSYPIKFTGIITNILPKEFFEDSDYSHNFYKQKIHFAFQQQEYEIEFIKEKTSLLDNCEKGDEIEIDATLVARRWKDRIYNVLRGQKLKILKSDFREKILYDGQVWKLYKSFEEGVFKLLLQDVECKTRILCFGHSLLDQNFILIHPFYKESLIKLLENYAILTSGNTVQFQNQNYIVCQLNDVERIPTFK